MKSKKILPGTFREDNLPELTSEEAQRLFSERKEIERKYWETATPTFSDSLIESYNLFRNKIYEPKNVLYTSCDLDGTPLRAFPNSQVTFIDINKKAIDAMKRNQEFQDPRITLINGDVKEYQGKNLHDLVILLNPSIESKVILPYLSDGGYILANDWHQNSRQLKDINSVISRGTIVPRNEVKHIPARYSPEIIGLGKFADYFWIFKKK